jgi:hypothetical protein
MNSQTHAQFEFGVIVFLPVRLYGDFSCENGTKIRVKPRRVSLPHLVSSLSSSEKRALQLQNHTGTTLQHAHWQSSDSNFCGMWEK